jgi:hypothetical protein
MVSSGNKGADIDGSVEFLTFQAWTQEEVISPGFSTMSNLTWWDLSNISVTVPDLWM